MLSTISINQAVLLFTLLLVSVQFASAYRYIFKSNFLAEDVICESGAAPIKNAKYSELEKYFSCEPSFDANAVIKVVECPNAFKNYPQSIQELKIFKLTCK